MASVSLDHITKRFGKTVALDTIDLKIESGEIFFLLGPSGCGKSTLLRIIAGLHEPSGGRVMFDDRDVTNLPTEKRNAVMCFQSYALWPHMSVRENVRFGLNVRNVSTDEQKQRIDEVLRLVQMTEYADRKPNQLSGGQQQRVALARALAVKPDCLLLDEPLSNLDAKLRHETRVELKQLHQRLKATTVYVTHDQHEAMTLATQVVLMKDGEIIQVGTPLELYNRPVNRFAATFIGFPQINLMPGRLTPEASGTRFVGSGMDVLLPASIFSGPVTGPVEVELGLRPEGGALATGDAHQSLTVDYVEPTGADLYVNGHVDGRSTVIRLDRATTVAPGDQLPVRWRLADASVFALASGQRL